MSLVFEMGPTQSSIQLQEASFQECGMREFCFEGIDDCNADPPHGSGQMSLVPECTGCIPKYQQIATCLDESGVQYSHE